MQAMNNPQHSGNILSHRYLNEKLKIFDQSIYILSNSSSESDLKKFLQQMPQCNDFPTYLGKYE